MCTVAVRILHRVSSDMKVFDNLKQGLAILGTLTALGCSASNEASEHTSQGEARPGDSAAIRGLLAEYAERRHLDEAEATQLAERTSVAFLEGLGASDVHDANPPDPSSAQLQYHFTFHSQPDAMEVANNLLYLFAPPRAPANWEQMSLAERVDYLQRNGGCAGAVLRPHKSVGNYIAEIESIDIEHKQIGLQIHHLAPIATPLELFEKLTTFIGMFGINRIDRVDLARIINPSGTFDIHVTFPERPVTQRNLREALVRLRSYVADYSMLRHWQRSPFTSLPSVKPLLLDVEEQTAIIFSPRDSANDPVSFANLRRGSSRWYRVSPYPEDGRLGLEQRALLSLRDVVFQTLDTRSALARHYEEFAEQHVRYGIPGEGARLEDVETLSETLKATELDFAEAHNLLNQDDEPERFMFRLPILLGTMIDQRATTEKQHPVIATLTDNERSNLSVAASRYESSIYERRAEETVVARGPALRALSDFLSAVMVHRNF